MATGDGCQITVMESAGGPTIALLLRLSSAASLFLRDEQSGFSERKTTLRIDDPVIF